MYIDGWRGKCVNMLLVLPGCFCGITWVGGLIAGYKMSVVVVNGNVSNRGDQDHANPYYCYSACSGMAGTFFCEAV